MDDCVNNGENAMIVSIPVSTFEYRANFAKPWEQIPQLDGLYVAGGACRKLFLGQFQDSDVDVFATSKEVLETCREKLEASGFVFKWGNDTVIELHRATDASSGVFLLNGVRA